VSGKARPGLLCGALVLCACATGHVPRIGEPPPTARDEGAEKAWQLVLTRYSDRAQVYDGLDTRLFCAATLQTPLFVEARVRRMAAFQALPLPEADASLAAEVARLSQSTEVFFGVHANDPRHDDFDRPSSIWRLTLSACGQEYASTEVVRIGRASLNLRAIYPYMDTFWVAYRARFPKIARCEDKVVKLRIASTLGIAKLEFPAE
jgi:hypothetical protein